MLCLCLLLSPALECPCLCIKHFHPNDQVFGLLYFIASVRGFHPNTQGLRGLGKKLQFFFRPCSLIFCPISSFFSRYFLLLLLVNVFFFISTEQTQQTK